MLDRTFQCCLLNGGVFLASILVFDYILLPSMKSILFLLGTDQYMWWWTKSLLSWTFGGVWIVPIFLLSKMINALWFQVNHWVTLCKHFTNFWFHSRILLIPHIDTLVAGPLWCRVSAKPLQTFSSAYLCSPFSFCKQRWSACCPFILLVTFSAWYIWVFCTRCTLLNISGSTWAGSFTKGSPTSKTNGLTSLDSDCRSPLSPLVLIHIL